MRPIISSEKTRSQGTSLVAWTGTESFSTKSSVTSYPSPAVEFRCFRALGPFEHGRPTCQQRRILFKIFQARGKGVYFPHKVGPIHSFPSCLCTRKVLLRRKISGDLMSRSSRTSPDLDHLGWGGVHVARLLSLSLPSAIAANTHPIFRFGSSLCLHPHTTSTHREVDCQ